MLSLYKGIATIIMLHRVFPLEPNKLPPNENLKVSPEFLETFIVGALHRGYAFVSLDDLHNILSMDTKASKLIVMTLDDGYADNFTYAYPIFKKFNIPFVIYVTTSFPDKSVILWWHVLEDMIAQSDSISLTNGLNFKCETKKQKIDAFMTLRKIIIDLPNECFLHSLNKLFKSGPFDWSGQFFDLVISWKQLKEISESPLATIGAHTVNHHALSGLSNKNLTKEIIDSKVIIESHIGTQVEHFCYPFGGRIEAGEREFRIVKELGFRTAVTTRFGNIFSEHSDHLLSLPRVMLTNQFLWSNFNFRSMKQFLKCRVVTA
ncbi:polysaccharide deacetylase family protein [Methylomonas montana]|uniref:polysaccharide deacetylase family protein n=1 Tax=Methylomonas montana TaxID=3058963 RepID=UPI0026589404|nr:polysaccharide deacetylase family protein [Methylomonas montana]WKJ88628.1 polysaccharide deacetylase family protein [Methylomonas montana]